MKRVTVTAAVLSLITMTHTALFAGTFDHQVVAEDAVWVAHLDLERLWQTQTGEFIMEQLNQPGAERKLAAFAAVFRFDPRRDIDNVTLYGTATRHDEAVALIAGRFDSQQILTLVAGNATYEKEVYAGKTIHSWIDDKRQTVDAITAAIGGKRNYGCFYRDDLVVASGNLAMAKEALDVLDGRNGNLSGSEAFVGLDRVLSAAFFIAAADMDGIPEITPKAALLKQNDAVALSLAEVAGGIQGALLMVAKDEASAAQVHAMSQGIIAFLSLRGAEDPRVARLTQALKVALSGKEVEVTVTYPVAEAIEFLKTEHADKLKWVTD